MIDAGFKSKKALNPAKKNFAKLSVSTALFRINTELPRISPLPSTAFRMADSSLFVPLTDLETSALPILTHACFAKGFSLLSSKSDSLRFVILYFHFHGDF